MADHEPLCPVPAHDLLDAVPDRPEALLPSPCVGICQLDPLSGLCLGCARDADELAAWRAMSTHEQAGLWRRLPGRLARFGHPFRLLPWTGQDLVSALLTLAAAKPARWSIGPAVFVSEGRPRAHDDGLGFDETTSLAAFAFRFAPGLRCFAMNDGRLVLALHQARLKGEAADVTAADNVLRAVSPLGRITLSGDGPRLPAPAEASTGLPPGYVGCLTVAFQREGQVPAAAPMSTVARSPRRAPEP
ncbi:DUF1289 domain-containing protein [Marinivivus vitaminiproducens]|uniref:DUF1289 domain-containing protein n=1 Tax=Marinivivus vitaminiproducens TaxID=3035935 RepID=UPI0027983961|nr:DUF1289 domain-containing protein [Geminicoccaceae bacterium SCSIO 64248]